MREIGDIVRGEVFWYAVGCFYEWADGSLQDVGYFAHLGGLPEPLFRGAPGPAGAWFTFAAEPFRSIALPPNDPADTFTASIDPPRRFSLYYRAEPAGDFAHPESFARGLPIATFERATPVVGAATTALASNCSPRASSRRRRSSLPGSASTCRPCSGSASRRWGPRARRSPPPPEAHARRVRSWEPRCGSDHAPAHRDRRLLR